VVLSIKELKGGGKVVKLSNLKELLEEKATVPRPKVKENVTAVEVYHSLLALR
jgi:hypothetical protein